MSNERQMGFALAMYVGENSGHYPFSATVPGANPKKVIFWFDALSPYLGNPKWGTNVFACPTYKWTFFEGSGDGDTGYELPLGSYAYNAYGANALIRGQSGPFPGGLGSPHTKDTPWGAVAESAVKVPADMFALGDAKLLEIWGNGWRGGECEYPMSPYWNNAPAWWAVTSSKFIPHRGYNMLFVDGHAQQLKRELVFDRSSDTCLMHWNVDHSALGK